MTPFLNDELAELDKARRRYAIAQRRTAFAAQRAKYTVRTWIASPQGIVAFFGAGAYKGAVSSAPSRERSSALNGLIRTVVLKLIF